MKQHWTSSIAGAHLANFECTHSIAMSGPHKQQIHAEEGIEDLNWQALPGVVISALIYDHSKMECCKSEANIDHRSTFSAQEHAHLKE